MVLNLEVPRGRKDFDVQIVHNKYGKTFLIPKLGDMQLPGILAERGDEVPPEELAEILKSLVLAGKEGWQEPPIQELSLTEEEIDIVQKYLHVKRFETLFRKCLMTTLQNTYGESVFERVSDVLGANLAKIQRRMKHIANKYGRDTPELNLDSLLEHLGFENYIQLVEHNSMWSKCLSRVFKDRAQTREALRVIGVARNEIVHFRAAAHPRLWEAALMYLDILEGRIRMVDPTFRKLVEMVQGRRK
jgi:hypothetical protein